MNRIPQSTGQKILRLLLLLPLFVLVSPILVLALVLSAINKLAVYLIVWFWWLPNGKSILFVSSESPIWREYMEAEILPLVAGRAVILNWSERTSWRRWSLPVRVFRAFARRREFNPMVIVFKPLKRARVFRFFPAFKKLKHGDADDLVRLRQDLIRAL